MEKSKISSITKSVAYIVEFDDDDMEWPTYRTNGKGHWENLMGECSWEESMPPRGYENAMLKDLMEEYHKDNPVG